MRSRKALVVSFLAGVLSIPAWAGPTQGPQNTPQPGLLNYMEGQASIGSQALTQSSVGSAQLQAGQTLATQSGKAEVLLTPGVVLRIDGNSAVVMNAAGLADTELTVQAGRAMVEAGEVLPTNRIVIHEGPAVVRLMKNGLYDFDAVHGQVRVFDGRVEVSLGGKSFTVQGGHEFDLTAAKLKARGFDKDAFEDNFYRWSSLRSSYLAEANVDAARGFAQGYYGGPSYYAGYYPGWFWDPYFSAYTWLPGDGIFYSPFGWGFYSPGFVYAAPFYGYRGGFHGFGPSYRPSVAAVHGTSGRVAGNGFSSGGFHVNGGVAGGGFHSSGGFAGGGFHSSGGFAGGGFRGGGGGRR